tara:strand:- start:51 stop:635 length:585 start_codon:yes stop_codon:yes gene_type:complete
MSQVINQHIPKTGSTSTKNFYKDCIRYGHQDNKDTLNGDIPQGAISFTIVREPLDRFVSNITYFLSRGVTQFEPSDMIDICLNHTYTNKEMAQVLKNNNMKTEPEINMAFHSISIFHPFINVFDENKNLRATHLIDFKNIVSGLEKILPDYDYTKFAKINASRGTINIELTEQQKADFNIKYAQDIQFYKETGF